MLFIILKNIIVIACIYGAYRVAKHIFDDQKLLRILLTAVLSVLFFGVANATLNFLAPQVNVDKTLQKETIFVDLKSKYPQKYQAIVDDISLVAESQELDERAIRVLADKRLTPLALELVISASDQSRYEFTKSYIKSLEMMRDAGGNLCYNMMHKQDRVNVEQEKTVNEIFKKSGMQRAVSVVIKDNKVGKSIVSKKDMDQMEETIFKKIYAKHGNNIEYLVSPSKATTGVSKKIACQVAIDLYSAMNNPSDKVKMAVLRRNMEAMSSDIDALKSKNNSPNAIVLSEPETPMAESAFN